MDRRRQHMPLDIRRRELGMPINVLAKKSGVSVATIYRILSGEMGEVGFANVAAVAKALGLTVEFQPAAASETIREAQARKKAEWLVSLVQGTSGLEGQAVGREVVSRMVDKTTHELLAGSSRKLWSDW